MPPPIDDSRTLGEEAYQKLRSDIIAGRLLPQAKLTLRQMSESYCIGVSPLREALSRLASEKLVLFEGQRGFVVAPVSRAELDDIFSLRADLTCKAIRMAIANATDEWEDEIVISLRRLERTSRPGPSGDNMLFDEWESRHDRFHTALIATCGSPWLLHFCAVLSDQFQRYRRLIMRHAAASEDMWDEIRNQHRTIADAALEHDADLAAQLLHEHLNRSVETIKGLYPTEADPFSHRADLPSSMEDMRDPA